MKKCQKCGKIKSKSAFHNAKHTKDSIRAICKECSKEYYNKRYYSTDKEKKRLKDKHELVKKRTLELKSFRDEIKKVLKDKKCFLKVFLQNEGLSYKQFYNGDSHLLNNLLKKLEE